MQEKQPPVCSKCGYGNPGNFCPKCGAQQPSSKPHSEKPHRSPTAKRALVVAGVLLVIAIAGAGILISLGEKGERGKETIQSDISVAEHVQGETAKALQLMEYVHDNVCPSEIRSSTMAFRNNAVDEWNRLLYRTNNVEGLRGTQQEFDESKQALDTATRTLNTIEEYCAGEVISTPPPVFIWIGAEDRPMEHVCQMFQAKNGIGESLNLQLTREEWESIQGGTMPTADTGRDLSVYVDTEGLCGTDGTTGSSPQSATICDEPFRNQLARNPAAHNAIRMNQVKEQVQQALEECTAEVWNPVVIGAALNAPEGRDHWRGAMLPTPFDVGINNHRCATLGPTVGGAKPTTENRTIGDLSVPGGLIPFVSSTDPGSGRDEQNNIIVFFSSDVSRRPSDGAPCWMYVESIDRWFEGTQH